MLFFPYVRDRLKTKLKVPSSLTAVLTGHGKPKRFHIIENSMCPCEQSVNHILYKCGLVKKIILIKDIQKTEVASDEKYTNI